MVKPITENTLFYGDNLPILREYIPDESIDLIYLDPPFNSNRTYNVLFKQESGQDSEAQIAAFEDTWHWNQAAEETYHELVTAAPPHVGQMIGALRGFIGQNQMMAYLVMMAARLVELHRVLKPTGSLYLHCDPTASHYLKILLDTVFSPKQFRNEIIWRRTGAHGPRRIFGPIHDTILFYSKSDRYYFKVVKKPYMRGHVDTRYNEDESGRLKFTSGGNVLTGAGATKGESGQSWMGFDPSAKNRHWAIPGFLAKQMPPDFSEMSVLTKLDALYEAGLIDIVPGNAWPTPVRYLDKDNGHPVQDIWAYQPYTSGTVYGTEEGIDEDVAWLGTTDPERLGYPTQKPIGLLERIIKSSCPTEGTILDPFCGCGTTIAAAQKLGRRWVGIDITHLSIALLKNRLITAFPDASYRVIGEPTTLDDAHELALEDRFQFQWWAASLVKARPHGGQKGSKEGKKGADKGIDGLITFVDDHTRKPKRVIVQVKSGKVSSRDIRDLVGTLNRESAAIGVFLTLEEPTRDMRTEAVTAGFYHSPGWNQNYPRVQILTVKDLLDGTARLVMPPAEFTTFKQAQQVKEEENVQKGLFD